LTTFGSGKFQYQVVEPFFKRPRRAAFIDGADVAVDKDDNVYLFARSAYAAVMVFDKDGDFLDSWGRMGDDFGAPHGITVGPDGNVYTADNQNHTLKVWTKEGKLLLTLGRANQNAPVQSGDPFNMPTHLSVASNGDLFGSDGYQNSRVHCFDPYGKLKFSWGGHGSGQGQFDTIHSVFVDYQDGDKVYAADRYNNRVQFFTPQGEFLGEWTGLNLANSVRRGTDGNFYVAELDHRISVLSPEGELLARWGDTGVELDDSNIGSGLPTSPSRNPMLTGKVTHEPGPGLFCAPHGIAVDSEGSIYVAEVSESWTGLDRGGRSIQKFVRS
jgi:DNA-binding beta-propeller fold protein YncE